MVLEGVVGDAAVGEEVLDALTAAAADCYDFIAGDFSEGADVFLGKAGADKSNALVHAVRA